MDNDIEAAQCAICHAEKPAAEMIPVALIHDPILEKIRQNYPSWTGRGYICARDLNQFRLEYVRDMLRTDRKGITKLEEEVVSSIHTKEILSRNPEDESDINPSFGDRAADKIAEFGGSWRFIISFGAIIFCWIVINSYILLAKPFDPHPFILLNLLLSCLAALQAPVIMMSQNRQESKDRLRARNDYQVNLKAELEIRQLHEKLDFFLAQQWQRLLEIQQIQLEFMEEITFRFETGNKASAENSGAKSQERPA